MRANSNSKNDFLITGLLLAIPVILFLVVWTEYAVNIPHWDDFVLKWFPLLVERQTEIKGSIYQFFKQHNEHRIVYDRVVTYLDYIIFGKINFLHLMAIGNLSLLGLLAIYGAELRRAGIRVIYLVPLSFLIFNLSQWENMFWGMAALQNFTVVLWVLWAMYGLAHWKPAKSLPLAFGLGVLATLTSGNGLLIWPIGAVLLLLQRRWTSLVPWLGGASILVGLYFTGYSKPPANPALGAHFSDLFIGWLVFIGSAGEVFPFAAPFYPCAILGALLMVGSVAVIYDRMKRGLSAEGGKATALFLTPVDLFFLGSLGFIFATGLVVAFSRMGYGLDTLLTSRYKVYSLTLLSGIYVWIVVRIQPPFRQFVGGLGIILAVTFAYLSYVKFLDRAVYWRQYRIISQFNWTYGTNTAKPTLDANTSRLISNAPAFYDRHIMALYTTPFDSDRIIMAVDTQRHVLSLDVSTDYPNASRGKDAGIYVGLRSAQRLYIFNTERHLSGSVRAKLGLGTQYRPGFSLRVTEDQLDPGTYAVEYISVDANGNLRLMPTNQIFVVSPLRADLKKNW